MSDSSLAMLVSLYTMLLWRSDGLFTDEFCLPRQKSELDVVTLNNTIHNSLGSLAGTQKESATTSFHDYINVT